MTKEDSLSAHRQLREDELAVRQAADALGSTIARVMAWGIVLICAVGTAALVYRAG